ncbi:alpha/beta hydrolase [Devosia insulae DS-56]|uniref:Alpha/beta hydrolase n=1 Tax=Devosia insulae DS-56 TaxID=1116389 RepID=A0A1E5XIU0_9HYPH|nr:alpha/beta hydrolase [Devosia insulae]OEO28510.1 alpha/beta hydrolase [Devosia insulae DS-56]
MHKVFGAVAFAAAALGVGGAGAAEPAKPTVVLVHGAFADASGWNGVITQLNKHGYQTIAAANPLRSLMGDAAAVSALLKSIKGDVVLVGHSYGGLVITDAAYGNNNVKALVYVAGFIPDAGESAFALSTKFPGSTLGDALQPVPLPEGGVDLYIQPAKFHDQFAADLPVDVTALMAATQRPVTQSALEGKTIVATWKALPSYTIYGSADLNIPAAVQVFMADRAGVKRSVAIEGGSHALMVSHPDEVAAIIGEAANNLAD